MWWKGGIRNVKMSLGDLRIELPSGFLGGRPLHFPVLVGQKPLLLRSTSLSSTQRPVGNSAGTGWSSKCWESWKSLKWKCRVRTRDCNRWRFEGKWLRVPPANAELNILPFNHHPQAFLMFSCYIQGNSNPGSADKCSSLGYGNLIAFDYLSLLLVSEKEKYSKL